jgi:ribosomal protein S6--L-glutamate ligase
VRFRHGPFAPVRVGCGADATPDGESEGQFGILSRKKSLYSTRRLMEAARAHGLEPRVIDVLRCSLVLETGKPGLFCEGEELSGLSVALPRIGASVTAHGLQVLRQLEALSVPVVNGAQAIERSRDKLRALQLLAAQGVPVPRTVLARGGGDLSGFVAQVGGLPAILKLIRGTQGVGVMIAHSMAEVESILATLQDLGEEILLQEFVAESRGRDVRALVVGGRVAGAALRAARAMGLEVAGVDLLEARNGPMVLEVNSSPGFEGLEEATGLDIAGAIVERAKEIGRLP